MRRSFGGPARLRFEASVFDQLDMAGDREYVVGGANHETACIDQSLREGHAALTKLIHRVSGRRTRPTATSVGDWGVGRESPNLN